MIHAPALNCDYYLVKVPDVGRAKSQRAQLASEGEPELQDAAPGRLVGFFGPTLGKKLFHASLA
jgi:hypothetical protein